MIAEENFFPKKLTLEFDPFIRHFERYHTIVKFLGKTGLNETWLDCACGSGYGTNLLSNFTSDIIGYDISEAAVKYANDTYSDQHCKFTHTLDSLKIFDVIFSVETIEHMSEFDGILFLSKLHSNLKSDGVMLITTPIVDITNNNPKNKFHVLEYSDKDFIKLMEASGFVVADSFFIPTTFTDGESKNQGYYKCIKN
jgi:2-polyprenyl-3-methyl-5-hydroxy-6-metoxy-1,4-benzoquinol methylase